MNEKVYINIREVIFIKTNNDIQNVSTCNHCK